MASNYFLILVGNAARSFVDQKSYFLGKMGLKCCEVSQIVGVPLKKGCRKNISTLLSEGRLFLRIPNETMSCSND